MPSRGLSIDPNLARALAVSLAIHGVFLTPSREPPAASGKPALRATLRQHAGAPGPADAANVTEESPAAPTASREPMERTYGAGPASAGPDSAEGQGGTATAVPWGQADGAPQAGPDGESAQPASPGAELLGKRQYHLALSRMAARFRRYPPEARESGWGGRVSVRLSVSEDGRPANLKLLDSSGFPLLDQAAMEMLGLAANHTPIPEALQGRAFTIDLAVDYNPRDEQ